MGFDRERKNAGGTGDVDGAGAPRGTPGKTTLVEASFGVQMRRMPTTSQGPSGKATGEHGGPVRSDGEQGDAGR